MFERNTVKILSKRMREPRKFMQIVMGPRQTGKTTAIKQALEDIGAPYHLATADTVQGLGAEWIEAQWQQARLLARNNDCAILALDEIQKISGWSEYIKKLWDEDTWSDLQLKVILSGSSSLLLRKGLSDSMAGRFEVIKSPHWSYSEMKEAFSYTLDDFLRFGGYPGAAQLKEEPRRWKAYMKESIINATLEKDVLEMESIKKPELLKALFELGAQYSAQELSYRKILGQLDDKGNTDVIKHYLELLSRAGLLSGLQKYDAKPIKTRNSSPRLMVHDTALMTAACKNSNQLLTSAELRGHLVETAVGAHLIAKQYIGDCNVYWWRNGDSEVDFVVETDSALRPIEVKSGRVKRTGILEFYRRYPKSIPMTVGDPNTSLEDFLSDKISLG